ncbi:MAG: energy transducer TonB [Bacteroidales bacterium]|nr:energy transducer TonB [Bacteroidales bacterium]
MKNLQIIKLMVFVSFFGFIHSVSAQQDYLRVVDVMPQYPGGQQALSQFIQQHIVYPPEAMRLRKEGIVYVTFIVERDGNLTQIKASRGIGEDMEKEAENVVKKMPKWSPGQNAGETVRVLLSLPIEFKLRN